MLDKKFIGKPGWIKTNYSSDFEVFKTIQCSHNLSSENVFSFVVNKNGNDQFSSFPCYTTNHMASKYWNYLNDRDTCRKCKWLLVPSFRVSFLQDYWYCSRALWLSVSLQLHGAQRWADLGCGASPAMEPSMILLYRREERGGKQG